jgi:hypothetical protein
LRQRHQQSLPGRQQLQGRIRLHHPFQLNAADLQGFGNPEGLKGHADLVIGACGYDNYTGRAYLYLGE